MRLLLALACLLLASLLLASPASAALSQVGSAEGFASITGTSSNCAEPTGTASGDFVFVIAQVSEADDFVTKPSGMTVLYSGLSAGTAFNYYAAYAIRGGSALDLTFVTATGGAYRSGTCFTFRGQHASPIDAQAEVASDTSVDDPDPPSAAATVGDTIVIAAGVKLADINYTAPSGYTLQGSNEQSSRSAFKALVSAGAENPGKFDETGAENNSDRWAMTVIIKPALGAALRKKRLLGGPFL